MQFSRTCFRLLEIGAFVFNTIMLLFAGALMLCIVLLLLTSADSLDTWVISIVATLAIFDMYCTELLKPHVTEYRRLVHTLREE